MARNPPPEVTRQTALASTDGVQLERAINKQAPLTVVVQKGQQRQAPAPTSRGQDPNAGINAPHAENPRNLQPQLIEPPPPVAAKPTRPKSQLQAPLPSVPILTPQQAPQQASLPPLPPSAQPASPPAAVTDPAPEPSAPSESAKPKQVTMSRFFGNPVRTKTPQGKSSNE